jgi:MFS transporter, DHA1 family, tetracycline resistance protein
MPRRKSLLVVFLTVFIDLVGFGIVLPLLPIYSERHGASDFMIGLIIASFSAMQFLFAPAWGRLSDRIGRRPVLLVSNFGSVISYGMFGVSGWLEGEAALWVLLTSRVFAGICGANLSVANAYIADISPPEKRSKNMGLIGMAFGLGFILGPAMGSFSVKAFGGAGPGMVAAGVCLFNFLLTWTILGESRRPGTAAAPPARPKLAQWVHTLRQPTVGVLILIYFLAIYCFASFESTFSRLLHLRYDNADEFIGYLFTYCGVLAAAVQGGLIGRLVKWFGEARLIAASLIMFAVGLTLLPLLDPGLPWTHPLNALTWLLWLTVGLGFVSAGSAINRPPTFGLISMNTPADEQGATLGVAQSAGSLARILAPITANLLYQQSAGLPYYFCALISLAAGILTWFALCRQRPMGQ